MPISTTQARKALGTFDRSGRSHTASARRTRHAAYSASATALRLDSPCRLFTGALLLSGVLNASAPAPSRQAGVSSGSANAPSPQPLQAALLPSAAADYRRIDTATPPSLSARLSSLGNVVAAGCLARPRLCGSLLAVGALAVAGSTIGAVVEHLEDRQARPRALPPQQQDRLSAAVEAIRVTDQNRTEASNSLRDALLDIARRCGGDRQCRADAINALLQTLPKVSRDQLQYMVEATASQPSTMFPPGAEAAPYAGEMLDALVQLLADLYTPEVARYQDDLEYIVTATHEGAGDEATRNRNRLQAIRTLIERDGHRLEPLAFRAHDRLQTGLIHEGINLLASPSTSDPHAPARRRLLLVAHGDVAGLASGSDGAYDNASGVAAVLHVLRHLDPRTFADGTQVQALITSLEERHLLGSSAFVDQCMQQQDCPTLVVNVDMVGRGGHSYVLSGSDTLAGHYYVGKAPMNLAEPVPNPAEAAASEHLQTRFNADGFARQPAGVPLLLTSDNLAFQNASIATLGLAQMSAADATALRDIQRARIAYAQALDAVDWSRYADHHEGRVSLSPDELARYHEAQAAGDEAWEHYQSLRRQWARSSGQIIHTGADQLHRVNPRMAVDFSTALAAFVREWAAAPATGAPATHPAI